MALPTTSNVNDPIPLGYGAKLGTTYLRLAAANDRGLDIQTADTNEDEGPDTRRNPEDFRSQGEAKTFSMVDFRGGEGQAFFHRRDSEDNRFWRSSEVEVVRDTENQGIDILRPSASPDFRSTSSAIPASSEPFAALAVGLSGDYFQVNDDALYRWDNFFDGGSTATDEAGPVLDASINAMTVLDGAIYLLVDGQGIYERTGAGTYTQINSDITNGKHIWGLKGRLLVGTDSGVLYEVTSSGTSTTLLSLATGERFYAATDAGAAILVGASNGYVYAFANLDGTLTLRGQTPFRDEQITGLGARAGIVLIGTNQGETGRVYVGRFAGDYTIKKADNVGEWVLPSGEPLPSSPGNVAVTRDRFVFSVTEYRAGESQPYYPNIYEYRLDTGGLFRVHAEDKVDHQHYVALGVYEGVKGFMVDQGTTGQVATQSNDGLDNDGYVITSLADHFTSSDKVWASFRLFLKSLPTDTEVRAYVTTDPDALSDPSHASWTLVKEWNNGDTSDEEVLLSNVEGRWLAVQVWLDSIGSGATEPVEVRGFSVKSYPGPEDVQVVLPVNVSDRYERPGRSSQVIPGLGQEVYDFLKDKEGTSQELELIKLGDTFRGTVSRVSQRIPGTTQRGEDTVVALVEFTGRRV